MPETREIHIYGISFPVTERYAEGQTINGAEAKVLNQALAENIANNTRKAIAELRSEDGTFSDSAIKQAQELFAEREANYEFSLSSGGGGRQAMTPLEKEARTIARDYVRGKIKEQGKNVKDVDKETFDAKVDEVAAHDKVQKLAQKRLDERAKLADGVEVEL